MFIICKLDFLVLFPKRIKNIQCKPIPSVEVARNHQHRKIHSMQTFLNTTLRDPQGADWSVFQNPILKNITAIPSFDKLRMTQGFVFA